AVAGTAGGGCAVRHRGPERGGGRSRPGRQDGDGTQPHPPGSGGAARRTRGRRSDRGPLRTRLDSPLRRGNPVPHSHVDVLDGDCGRTPVATDERRRGEPTPSRTGPGT